MNFKRKIALILLGGLMLGLFSSYMLAMETAVIKDFTGQTVQLDDSQRTALRGCETLKYMIEDTGMHEVPFEDVAPFITAQNFQRLSHLIKDKAYIHQLIQNQDCIELFQFADYMKAPKESLSVLADRIYEPLRAKIKATADEGAKADLEYFCETVESNLSFYPNFHVLLRDNKRNLDTERIPAQFRLYNHPAQFALNVPQQLDKKLRSLEGIEELSSLRWAEGIKKLYINNHEIEKFDLSQIRKVFPNLTHLSLSQNKIKIIKDEITENNILIDLRNNPVQSINVDNPRSLQKAQVWLDKDARPVVTFNQSRFDKCAAWLEALKAQGKVALNRESTLRAAVKGSLVGIGVFAAGLPAAWLINKYRGFDESLLSVAKNFTFFEYVGAFSFISAAGVIGNLFDNRNLIRQELAQLAHQDGDHVSIKFTEPYHHGDTRTVQISSCPSKYAYNLFGKN